MNTHSVYFSKIILLSFYLLINHRSTFYKNQKKTLLDGKKAFYTFLFPRQLGTYTNRKLVRRILIYVFSKYISTKKLSNLVIKSSHKVFSHLLLTFNYKD